MGKKKGKKSGEQKAEPEKSGATPSPQLQEVAAALPHPEQGAVQQPQQKKGKKQQPEASGIGEGIAGQQPQQKSKKQQPESSGVSGGQQQQQQKGKEQEPGGSGIGDGSGGQQPKKQKGKKQKSQQPAAVGDEGSVEPQKQVQQQQQQQQKGRKQSQNVQQQQKATQQVPQQLLEQHQKEQQQPSSPLQQQPQHLQQEQSVSQQQQSSGMIRGRGRGRGTGRGQSQEHSAGRIGDDSSSDLTSPQQQPIEQRGPLPSQGIPGASVIMMPPKQQAFGQRGPSPQGIPGTSGVMMPLQQQAFGQMVPTPTQGIPSASAGMMPHQQQAFGQRGPSPQAMPGASGGMMPPQQQVFGQRGPSPQGIPGTSGVMMPPQQQAFGQMVPTPTQGIPSASAGMMPPQPEAFGQKVPTPTQASAGMMSPQQQAFVQRFISPQGMPGVSGGMMPPQQQAFVQRGLSPQGMPGIPGGMMPLQQQTFGQRGPSPTQGLPGASASMMPPQQQAFGQRGPSPQGMPGISGGMIPTQQQGFGQRVPTPTQGLPGASASMIPPQQQAVGQRGPSPQGIPGVSPGMMQQQMMEFSQSGIREATPPRGVAPSREPTPADSRGSAPQTPRSVPSRGSTPQDSRGSTPVPAESRGRGHPQAGRAQPPADNAGIMSLQIPARRGCGQRGRKIELETNHLALRLPSSCNPIMHYDVKFVPDRPKRLLRYAMEEFRLHHYPLRHPAFDGKKNLYSSGELPVGREFTDTITVKDEESSRPMEFVITIKQVGVVDFNSLKTYMKSGASLLPPQKAIQAIDVALRHAATFKFVSVGRSLFSPPPPGQVVSLGDGQEMWYGFFQSAYLGWKPFVNVDVAHKAFPKPVNVIDTIWEVCNLREDRDLDRELGRREQDFRVYMKGLKVEYKLPNVPGFKRVYRVNGIGLSAARQMFPLDDGQEMSVLNYFAQEKKVNLRYPNMPVLSVGAASREKKIFLPPELCTVMMGQVINSKMNEKQTAAMVRVAATDTYTRKRKILEALAKIGYNQDECIREFGISVSDNFERVNGRVLDPPKLEYRPKGNENIHIIPDKGVWRASEFLITNRLTSWIILNMNERIRREQLDDFIKQMRNAGRGLGMEIGEPLPTRAMGTRGRYTRDLQEFFNSMKGKVQLVVVIIPEFVKDCYAMVKQVAELQVGILTQCVKDKTIFRMKPATCSNILLKVNSKLNGINHSLAPVSRPPCLKVPVMIVGADVTHPSPQQTNIPSVAAVAASHDPKAFKYNIQIRLQEPREEIIKDLENIMRIQIEYFKQQTNYEPRRIIFYRDGVSEGQFKPVLDQEVQALRRACASVGLKDRVQITFLVVQKRHHTRLFPTRRQDEDGKNKNVPAGTIVDTDITHPTEFDFFLVSHASIQGVSRPTKYHLLWNDDDEGMTTEVIEHLTYYLCHLFSRCTRSVSYPAPTYNAHLAAFRARAYLVGRELSMDNLEMEQRNFEVMREIICDHPMYFV